jgi:hypothetical protein
MRYIPRLFYDQKATMCPSRWQRVHGHDAGVVLLEAPVPIRSVKPPAGRLPLAVGRT